MHGYRSSIFFDHVSFSGNFSWEQTFVQLLLVFGGTFQNCCWKISTKFVKTAIYASREKFPMKKKYVDSDNLIFSQVISFFEWNFAGLLEEKTRQGYENYILNILRIVLSKSVFLRKLKFSKFFGNFSEIRRKFFRSLGEVFRRRLSKLHFTGLEKLFEGFYFEVKRNFWPFNGHWAKHFWNVCKFFGMAVKIAS